MRRTQFLTLVSEAVHTAQPEGIARVDTIIEGLDPTGLEVTTADGTVYRLRALCTTGRGGCASGQPTSGRRYSRRSI